MLSQLQRYWKREIVMPSREAIVGCAALKSMTAIVCSHGSDATDRQRYGLLLCSMAYLFKAPIDSEPLIHQFTICSTSYKEGVRSGWSLLGLCELLPTIYVWSSLRIIVYLGDYAMLEETMSSHGGLPWVRA